MSYTNVQKSAIGYSSFEMKRQLCLTCFLKDEWGQHPVCPRVSLKKTTRLEETQRPVSTSALLEDTLEFEGTHGLRTTIQFCGCFPGVGGRAKNL